MAPYNLSPEDIERVNSGGKGSFVDSLSEFGSGFVEGIKEDPFVALALKSLENTKGISERDMDTLRREAKGSTASQFGKFLGEFTPTLLLGLPLGVGGAAAGRAAIQAIAKKTATQAAAREALEAAARAGTRLPRLQEQLTLVSARAAGNSASKEALVQGNPAIQRAAESLGANIAFTNLVAAQELARGKPPVEALKTAALSAALFGGFDAALLGGSKLLFPGTRAVNLVAHRVAGEKGLKLRKETLKKLKTQRQEMNDDVLVALGAGNQQLELLGVKGTKSQRLREILNPPARPEKPPGFRQLVKQKGEAIADDLEGLSRVERKEIGQQIRLEAKQEATDLRAIYKHKLEPIKVAEKEARRVQKILDDRRLLRSQIRETEKQIAEEGTIPYVGTFPYHLGPVSRIINWVDPEAKLRTGLTSAPEAFFAKFGPTGNRFFTQFQKAADRINLREKTALAQYSTWSERLRVLVGEKSASRWKEGYGKHLDSSDAWELGGPNGLREWMKNEGRPDKDIEEAISIFQAAEDFEFNVLQKQGRQVGGRKPINPKDFGNERYITHSSRSEPNERLVQRAVEDGRLTELEAREIMSNSGEHLDDLATAGIEASRPGDIGPLDFYRQKSGTYGDKVRAGLPMNPAVWDARLRVVQGAYRRIELDPLIGRRKFNTQTGKVEGDLIPDLVAAVEAEGGNGAQFKSVVDTVAGRTYYNENLRKMATFTTSLEVAAKLPSAVFANASQPILTASMVGIKRSMKAFFKLTAKENRENISALAAINEHMLRGVGHTWEQEGLALTTAEKISDYTLRFTLFNQVERINRMHGAVASQVVIRDTLAAGFRDRLKGVNLDTARRRLGELGIDLKRSVEQMKEFGPEAFFKRPEWLRTEEAAIIRGAQKTQFFPGSTRTPKFWKHPLGRVIFQFKTFATGHGRFMRDVVLNEYAQGNVMPLATYLAAAPIAGELVGSAKSLINQKDRTSFGLMRALENASYVGGVGLFSDAFQQARWGNLTSFYLGPAISDVNDLIEGVLSPEGQSISALVKRQQIWKSSRFLLGVGEETTELIDEYLDSRFGEGEEPRGFIDVGQRLTERIQSKR